MTGLADDPLVPPPQAANSMIATHGADKRNSLNALPVPYIALVPVCRRAPLKPRSTKVDSLTSYRIERFGSVRQACGLFRGRTPRAVDSSSPIFFVLLLAPMERPLCRHHSSIGSGCQLPISHLLVGVSVIAVGATHVYKATSDSNGHFPMQVLPARYQVDVDPAVFQQTIYSMLYMTPKSIRLVLRPVCAANI